MAEPPVYFAYTGGRQIGPLRFAEMADLASRGVLKPDDLAWKSGTPEWVAASQLLAFPGRKSPSGVFASLGVASAAPEGDAGGAAVPAESVPAAVSASQPVAESGPSPNWPRVSLTKISDDPGIALAETAGVREGAPQEAGRPGSVHRLASLLPLRRLTDEAVLGSPVTWALVFFGLGPLFISAVAEDPLLRIRLLDFGCGAFWVVFFYAAFRTESATSRTVLAVFFVSALFAALYFALLASWPPVSTLAGWAAPARGFGFRFLAALGGTALVQEAGKLTFLFLAARSMRALESESDGLFYGLVAGAAFGLCASLVESWPPGLAGDGRPTSGVEQPPAALYAAFLGRLVQAVTLPFLHAVWTALAGTFLAPGIRPAGREVPRGRLALGLGLAVLLHALYTALATPAPTLIAFFAAAAAVVLLLTLKRNVEEGPILNALR